MNAPAAIAEPLAKMSNHALCLVWDASEKEAIRLNTAGKSITPELALFRSWVQDEFETRMGEDRYDAWLMDDADHPDPRFYLDGTK